MTQSNSTQSNFLIPSDHTQTMATAIPPLSATTTPLPSPYDDLMQKYLKKAAANEKDARDYTPERLQEIVTRIEQAVAAKNFDRLRNLRFRDTSPFSREVFTRITGVMLAKNQKECLAVIEAFVGRETVAAYESAKETARAEQNEKALRERLSYRYVRFESRRISTKQFIDEIIARGFTVLSERKHGAAPEYGIAQPDGTRYVLRRKDERDYAAARLRELTTAATPQATRDHDDSTLPSEAA